MDHRAFLSSLPPETRAALTARSDAAGLRHLAGHLGALGLTGTGIAMGWPGWPLLLPLHGVLLVFLFTLQHETIHDTPFRSVWLNRRVGQACGIVLLLPPVWFRAFHHAHHRFTQQPGKDPELAEPKPETRRAYLWHLSGLPLWRSQLQTLWRNARGRNADAFVPPRRRGDVTREARLMLTAYAGLAAGSLALGSAALVWLWLLPMVLGQPVLRAYLLAEHGRCATVSDMFRNTRTTFTTRLVRALAWNMPYHTEHHAFPAVPFHRLPDLHGLMAPHLGVTERGYARFNRRYLEDLPAQTGRFAP